MRREGSLGASSKPCNLSNHENELPLLKKEEEEGFFADSEAKDKVTS